MPTDRLRFASDSFLMLFMLITLVFAGTVQYFLGVGSVLWLPFLLTLIMFFLYFLMRRTEPLNIRFEDVVILLLLGTFLVLELASTLSQRGVMITIVGLKNEVGLMLLLFILMFDFCNLAQLDRAIKLLYLIFYIQIPVILFQIFIILPKRVAYKGEYEMWDSVVGTFGGDPMGGGNTATLGLFVLLIMLLKVSAYKHGATSLLSTLLHVTLGFAICVVSEVKFVLLLSPILLLLLWISKSYLKGMKQYDIKILLGMLMGTIAILSLAIFILSLSYSSAFGGDPSKGALDVFMDSLDYIFDSNFIMPSGELGRMTTIFYWLKHNELYGTMQMLFGYGLNATNHGSAFSPGFLNVKFNVLLDSTSLSMLLWETGIIGTLLFITGVLYVFRSNRGIPLYDRKDLNKDEITLLSYGPAFNIFALACLLSLPYSPTLMLTPMLQFLLYFTLGSNISMKRTLLMKKGLL